MLLCGFCRQACRRSRRLRWMCRADPLPTLQKCLTSTGTWHPMIESGTTIMSGLTESCLPLLLACLSSAASSPVSICSVTLQLMLQRHQDRHCPKALTLVWLNDLLVVHLLVSCLWFSSFLLLSPASGSPLFSSCLLPLVLLFSPLTLRPPCVHDVQRHQTR